MTTTDIHLSAAADADFVAIIDFLKLHAGSLTAQKYLDLFGRLFRRLQDFPESGARRPGLGGSVRIGVVRPYVVLYRLDREPRLAVVILRIVHGRRKIDGKLLQRLH